jgi:hypothetical protein
LVDYSSLPSGGLALLSMVVGFIASLPFQTSTLGGEIATNTGLPINTIAANNLNYADLAYVVGFAVSFIVYWIAVRATAGRMVAEEAAA